MRKKIALFVKDVSAHTDCIGRRSTSGLETSFKTTMNRLVE
jgi:hypothetical protein